MVKLSVLYPAGENITFDIDYYCNTHMPMVRKALGTALRQLSVEQGLAGGAPGAPPTYIAMGHLYFDSLPELQAAVEPHVATFMADAPNYTNAQPSIQISEVKV